MRESAKITRGYQFGYMILKHFLAAVFILLIELLIFGQLLTMDVVKYIVSAIFIFCYAVSIYTASNTLASKDMKPYTPLNPNIKFGVLWGIAISATIIIAYVIYRINWSVFSENGSMVSLPSVLYNAFYMLWTSPYFGLYSSTGGEISYLVVILMVILPPIMSTLGYYTAIKKIFLSDKIIAFMHEKDEK